MDNATPNELLVALRQYQHNDCSGLLAGFDYEKILKIYAHKQAEIDELKKIINDIWSTEPLFPDELTTRIILKIKDME